MSGQTSGQISDQPCCSAPVAITNIAHGEGRTGVRALICLILAIAAAGCTVLDKPQRAQVYDFGAVPADASAPATADALPPLALAAVDANQALDGLAVLYRLDYADPQQLRRYAQARWSAPPAELVRQRLREILGRQRTVLDPGTAASPLLLRIDLDEFSQQFASPQQSAGVIRLRATLLRLSATGAAPVAQRSLRIERPAASPDARGGVQALAAATDAAAEQIAQWLISVR
ncbi:MAG: membrane integrity-associated transporter subunit PqiC [Proteobacteria bacterium]|nr:membrane integrity-associated transporter subunit PqiC [Pseudomonadota bacterium]